MNERGSPPDFNSGRHIPESTFLELFYDLFYVVVISQATGRLADGGPTRDRTTIVASPRM